MSFSDLRFLFYFLPPFILIHTVLPCRAKNAFLLLGSLGVYAVGAGWPSAALLACLTLVNYAIARLITCSGITLRRTLVVVGLVIDLGGLMGFKYLPSLLALMNQSDLLSLALPLGISFYMFQNAAYLIDVYRGDLEAERNVLDYGAFIVAFPQLIMGPILRYDELSSALKHRTVRRTDLEQGFQLFVVGLGFKILLADQLATLWASLARIGYGFISTPLAWMGAVGYSLQLYFDFQGYSLMAMGLGRMLALPIPRNFDGPYLSRSVSEFYRRWHITLGRWFRDYLYIPLGGSRCGASRTALSLAAVWLATGIWHGTQPTFLIWAGVLCAFILLEKFVLHDVLARHRIFSHLYTLFIIVQTWVIFRITDLNALGAYFSRLYPFFGTNPALHSGDFIRHLSSYWWLLALGVLFCLPLPRRFYAKHKNSVLVWIPLLAIFWLSVYFIATGSGNSFLYSRF